MCTNFFSHKRTIIFYLLYFYKEIQTFDTKSNLNMFYDVFLTYVDFRTHFMKNIKHVKIIFNVILLVYIFKYDA